MHINEASIDEKEIDDLKKNRLSVGRDTISQGAKFIHLISKLKLKL